MNLIDSAALRLSLSTATVSGERPQLLRDVQRPRGLASDGEATNPPPMVWLPIAVPASAAAMAFDFSVEGDPADDVLVCGIGDTNLFSLGAKYIPTNAFSASRLLDVSAWAGTTNELFFGFVGGTSTNATLQIENIRFYSLAQPALAITNSVEATLLSWPTTAAGYVLESTAMLTPPQWSVVTYPPMILGDRYVVTNRGVTRRTSSV